MSLQHAILVMLEREPGSGYDLLRNFRGSLGYFWNAKHQQIYRQLKLMREQGLISVEDSPQEEKPDKKIYHITEEGLRELDRWLTEPVAPNKINDALLVKIYGTKPDDNQHTLEEIERHRDIHKKQLEQLKEIEQRYLALDPKQKERYQYPYLTLRRGIIGEEAWISWAEEAIHLFKK